MGILARVSRISRCPLNPIPSQVIIFIETMQRRATLSYRGKETWSYFVCFVTYIPQRDFHNSRSNRRIATPTIQQLSQTLLSNPDQLPCLLLHESDPG